ncbi:MAG: DNA-processing protein DprA [Bacteroidales bacterium]|nr:DNA-processing protein DprA [Bacteroidales bacterium]
MTKIDNETYYSILLTQIKGIGPINYNRLINHYGSAESIFNNIDDIIKLYPKIGLLLKSQTSNNSSAKENTEKEMAFIEKHGISAICLTSNKYPFRLKECLDAPIILFFKGDCDLNSNHIISIVGTRKSTSYGTMAVENFINDIAARVDDLIIISGLAYGIDGCAHRASIKNNIKTIGVLAHGLDMIYPYTNRQLAKEMISSGGLITEFPSSTTPKRGNFISRNRIIAGMSDAVIIAETGEKGGSIITANIALSYNKDIFAFPGRINDKYSSGCNNLIKENKAALIGSADDLIKQMNWSSVIDDKNPHQLKIEFEADNDEMKVIELLSKKDEMNINLLALETSLPINQLSSILLELEMKYIVRSFPGGVYKLIKY